MGAVARPGCAAGGDGLPDDPRLAGGGRSTEDFVRTARAKGVRERIVVRRHALRAALSPVIGLVSVNVALLVTNVIVIERAFNLPGFFRVAGVGQIDGLGNYKLTAARRPRSRSTTSKR